MTEKTLDLNVLRARINEVKEESNDNINFSMELIRCLLARHDLQHSIPTDFCLDTIQQDVINYIQSGCVPPRELLVLIDWEVLSNFLRELVWLCSATSIEYYCSKTPGENVGIFEEIISMMNESNGHLTGTYLLGAMTLMMSEVPSFDLVSALTNDFSDDEEQCQKNMNNFDEIIHALVSRYTEDVMYYDA